MVLFPVSMLAGLVVVGLLVGGVILLVVLLRGKGLGWVLGIAGAILAVLVLAAAVVVLRHWHEAGIRHLAAEAVVVEDSLARRARRELPQAAGPTLREEATGPAAATDLSAFPADVYPSAELAARAAADQLKASVANVTPSGEPLPTLRVIGDGKATEQCLNGVADAFRQGALVREVLVVYSGPGRVISPRAPEEIRCEVRVNPGPQGRVQLVLSGPGRQVTRSARFEDKQWAANFAEYMSKSPQPRVVGQSRQPCATFQEAEWAAMSDAAAQLLPSVRHAIDRALTSGRWRGRARPGDAELRSWILAEMRRGRLVADRFPQRFPRPYGEVWKQSLLVDASPPAVDGLALDMTRRSAARKSAAVRTWSTLAASIGGLAALIFLAYLVLNAATKGYYVLVLRLAAVAAILGGAVAILCVA